MNMRTSKQPADWYVSFYAVDVGVPLPVDFRASTVTMKTCCDEDVFNKVPWLGWACLQPRRSDVFYY